MPLFPPVTDTRRWPDLVAEARSSLVAASPRWTDHNVSDPGIAVLEMLAWRVDADLYRASRVTDRQAWKFPALLGHRPRGGRPARAVLVAAPGPQAPDELPAGLCLTAHPATAGPLHLTTLHPVRPTGAVVATAGVDDGTAEQSDHREGWTDHTAALASGTAWYAWGPDPGPGAALVLGLDRALPAGAELSLYLAVEASGGGTGAEPETWPAEHHDAETVWEFRSGGAWHPCTAVDATRALTRRGRVRLGAAEGVPLEVLGGLPERAWLRCRAARGRLDAAPRLRAVVVDAVEAEVARAAVGSFPLAPGIAVGPQPPVAGTTARLALSLDGEGRVRAVRSGVDEDAGPVVRVREWAPPGAVAPGRIALEAVVAGLGDGTPEQRFEVPVDGTLLADRTEVWLIAPDLTARRVELRPDLDGSGRTDWHAVLDPATAHLAFGDGRNGAVPEPGDTVLVCGATTSGAGSPALGPATRLALAEVPGNAALLGTAGAAALSATVALPPTGGADADDLAAVTARAERAVWAHERLTLALAEAGVSSLDELDPDTVARLDVPERAVTLADFERCASATPGTEIARVRALAETDPRLPGLRAAGCVTVVVVPRLPAGRPEPSAGLLRAVRAGLEARRTIGTRVFVTGPRYVDVGVSVTVAALPGADRTALVRAVGAALDGFLHPVTGGPHRTGWPFGRDVHRAEVLRVIDEVPGVGHVAALTLHGPGGSSHTAVRVPVGSLVAPAAHTVGVTGTEGA